MNRLRAVVRLHTVTWMGPVVWPWVICGLAFLVNWAFFAAMGDVDGLSTGGLVSLFFVALVMFASGVTQVFAYALGLGVTRRRFYAATALLAVAVSVVDAVALSALLRVENATGGWGAGMTFFGVVGDGAGALLTYAVSMLVASFAGVFVGVVYVRWRLNGAFALTAASIVGPGGLAVLVAWQGWWPAIRSWLDGQTTLALLAGWPLLLVAATALAGLLAIRRAPA